MVKINKRAFSKIRQEIDKLAISKRSRAMFNDPYLWQQVRYFEELIKQGYVTKRK